MSTAVNLSEIARRRYTTKAFDPSRSIPAETMDQLRTLLRYAPSSVNSQPWHFVIASSDCSARCRPKRIARGKSRSRIRNSTTRSGVMRPCACRYISSALLVLSNAAH